MAGWRRQGGMDSAIPADLLEKQPKSTPLAAKKTQPPSRNAG